MRRKWNNSKKGIALILTLGTILMLGVLAGSFAFFSTTATQTTRQYVHNVTAQSFADSGANLMLGAIREYFDLVVPEVVAAKMNKAGKSVSAEELKNGTVTPESSIDQKINSDDFNKLQTALSYLLAGRSVDFSDDQTFPFLKEISADLPSRIETVLKQWADKYGLNVSFNKNDSDVSFDVDLDGVNNYRNVSNYPGKSTELSLPELYAACVLKTQDGKMSAREFTENYGNFEQKDANWHTVKNEQSEFVGRFAVMAKDQASLINLQSSLGTQGLDDIASQAKTVDRSELSTLLTNNTTDLMNINTVLGSSTLTKPTYTTASTNSSRTLNLNMIDGKDFLLYLNEDQSLYSDQSAEFLLKFQKTNGKIAANFDDYTDVDNIPNVLSMFNWSEEEIDSLDPYGLKTGSSAILPTDIFMGQEGIRISEVMVMPEQAYTFSGATKNYAALVMTSSENRSETGYFYKPSGAKLVEQAYIAEQQRADVELQKIELSGVEDLSEGLAVKCGNSIEIRNPGGPYQVWVKMKVTAKATSSDTESGAGQLFNKITNSFYEVDTSNADIVVEKWVSKSDGSMKDIQNSTIISSISESFCNKFSEYNIKTVDWTGANKTLGQMFKDYPAIEKDDTVVIVAKDQTPPEWVLNPKMNVGADKTNVAVEYGTGATDFSDRVNNMKKNLPVQSEGQYSVPYPFGTRVIEMAMYDEGAGTDEAGQPKDELIGMFYCINTNGFAEDNAHMAKNKTESYFKDETWKDEDDDYLWFYSVGVPAWMKYDNLPSWLQVRTTETDGNPHLQASDASQEYFTNLCVFPRKECKLKFMFRLVDMADARFNMSEKASEEDKPNYTVGVESLKIGGTTYNSNTDLSGFGREHAIVGRPQWLKGDQVDVEIKEMVVSQQLYSTSLTDTYRENVSGYSTLEEYHVAKTYNYLESDNPVDLKLYPLSKDYGGVINSTDAKNELIFFRNQRLENRVANESHAGEYVELFNGSSKPVNLDGWVLKVEQYKKMPDGSYRLLGPESPYEALTLKDTSESAPVQFSYINPGFDYSNSAATYDIGRPDYILLSDTTLASAGEGQSTLPYAVIANGRMTAVDNGSTIKFSYTDNVFSPYVFENSSDIALGYSKMLTSQEAPAMEPGKVWLSPSNKLTEETLTSEKGDANYFVPVDQDGVSANGFKLRKNVFQPNETEATLPSTIPWKSLDYGNIDYETYNLVYGTFKKSGGVNWCNVFEVNSDSDSYHGNKKQFSVAFRSKDGSGIDPDWIRKNLTNDNPFTPYHSSEIFLKEEAEWGNLQNDRNTISDENLINRYLSLMLPVFGDDIKKIKNAHGGFWWTGKSGKWNEKKSNELVNAETWKYNYFNSDNKEAGVSEKIVLMKKVWPSNIEVVLNFKIGDDPAYPVYKEDSKGGAAQYSPTDTKFYVHFPWLSEFTLQDNTGIIVDNENSLFQLFEKRAAFLHATDSVQGNVIDTHSSVPAGGVGDILGTTLNFFPNNNGDKIFEDKDPDDGNDIEDMAWAFVPVRFHVVRELKEIVKENTAAVYDINTANIWNYLSKSELNLVKTFNIPYSEEGIRAVGKDSIEFDKKAYLQYHKNTGVNPLHFRDDADRIVLTLMAPKDEKVKISAGTTGKGIYSLESVAGKIFTEPDGDGDLPRASKSGGSYVIKGAAPFSQTYGEDHHISFGLASEMEWLCGYDKTSDRHTYDGEVSASLPSEAYNIADRAVLDRDVINKVYYKRYYDPSSGYSASDRKYDSYEKDPTRDWWGNRSVALSTFFTDPLLLRKAAPGTVKNPEPFSDSFNYKGRQNAKPGYPIYFEKIKNDSSSYGGKAYSFLSLKKDGALSLNPLNPFEEDAGGEKNEVTSAELIAQLSSRYWEPHIEVYKAGPGPLYKNLNFILTASGSPGQSNYRFNHIEGCTDYEADDHQNPHLNFRDFMSSVSLSDNIQNWAEELKGIQATFHYGDSESTDKTGTYAFYDLQHKGFDRTTHRLTTFNTHDCYIKDAPLSSISELCSVPAPGIENAGLNDNPLLSDSYTNSFVDGLESSLQYFTKLQKQKIFSGTSVDGSVLNLGVLTKMLYPDPVPSGTLVGESADSNPRVIKVSTVFDKNHWGINYLFKCVGDEKVFYPGKYRIYITGLDKDWNAFKSVIILPSMSLFNTLDASSKIDPEIVTKAGGTYLDNIDQIEVDNGQALTSDKMVQLLPLSGGEFFNVDDSLEITLVANPDSDSVVTNIASDSSSVKEVINKVTQSMDFKKINIYLVPQDKVGNVNINTAPIETLLRIPGLQDAIDSGVSGLQRTAANEVIKDILTARDIKKHSFTDAGDLLTYDFLSEDDSTGDANQKRIFPVTGDDKGVIATIGSGSELEEQRCKFAQLKCNIYEKMLPHIQFAGSSFEIISLGQTLNPKTGKVASSAKVSLTVDLKSLLEDLSTKFVYDPWNVGTNKLEQASAVTQG